MLRAKPANLEEVDEQRKYIESLPNKIGELLGDLEGSKVRRSVRRCGLDCKRCGL